MTAVDGRRVAELLAAGDEAVTAAARGRMLSPGTTCPGRHRTRQRHRMPLAGNRVAAIPGSTTTIETSRAVPVNSRTPPVA
jgi:hypothetical protein